MTTIATDGKTMAGDGQTVYSGTITSLVMRKVHRLKDGRIFGACGGMGDMIAVRRWLDEGGDKPKVASDFGAIMICPGGTALWSDDNLDFHDVALPAAMGSGMDIAIGAMLVGATPAHAVGIAAQRDIHTGGTIIVEALA